MLLARAGFLDELPMWTTRDGHILRLPAARLRAITRQVPECGLSEAVRSYYHGDLTRAVHSSVARLARSAYREGQLRHRPTGRRFPVFRAGSYRLVTCPPRGQIHDVLLIRPAADHEVAELEVPRSGTATVNWGRRVPLRQLPRRLKQQGGVYVIERGGVPVYVGQTKNFQRRMSAHQARFGPGARVRLGSIAAGTPTQRRTVEHALIRLLLGEGTRAAPVGQRRVPLQNLSSIQPYNVLPGNQVNILSNNTPSYLGRFFQRLAGGTSAQVVRGPGQYEFALTVADGVTNRRG